MHSQKKKVGKYQSCLSAPSYVPPLFEISRLPTTLWMTSGNLTKCEVSQELRLNETKLTQLKSCIFDVPLLFCIHVIYTVSFSVISWSSFYFSQCLWIRKKYGLNPCIRSFIVCIQIFVSLYPMQIMTKAFLSLSLLFLSVWELQSHSIKIFLPQYNR